MPIALSTLTTRIQAIRDGLRHDDPICDDLGDTIASKSDANQGGISPRLNGGVHNFKRFLEKWTGDNLNYSGSLINLFNSRNNNGSFKCCNTVYDPPTRNWVFDSTFLDPARLPPGTPFFQYVQTTGFEARPIKPKRPAFADQDRRETFVPSSLDTACPARFHTGGRPFCMCVLRTLKL